MRREAEFPELDYKVVATEPLVVALPSDHHLASQTAIAPHELEAESFLGMSETAPALRVIIDDLSPGSGSMFSPRTESTT
jgi:LysR family hca operon transcriptional activator